MERQKKGETNRETNTPTNEQKENSEENITSTQLKLRSNILRTGTAGVPQM